MYKHIIKVIKNKGVHIDMGRRKKDSLSNPENTETIGEIPILADWEATPDTTFMEFKGDFVEARYDKYFGMKKDNKLGFFIIKKNHYKDRMAGICQVNNYFLSYFDPEHELFQSVMTIKFIIDQKPNMSKQAFSKMLIKYVVTDRFIKKIKAMTDYLYKINIDTDSEGRYSSTPKITNEQAKLIVAISFAIRCILPICIHFSDTNNNFPNKKDYISCFDKIIMKLIRKFEKDDIEVFSSICRFVKYRVDRFWNQDIGICLKKKQLYGITKEIYLEEVIHEVILVKSLYKLDYYRSVVSFIDGVIFSYHYNFKIENFKFKPIEIDAQENTDSDNDHLSHAEAIEMSVYRVDESNAMISEVNTKKVLKKIRKLFNVTVLDEELEFYAENMKINPVTKLFLENFYSRYFHDVDAVNNVNRDVTIELLVYMKKYLMARGLPLIAQLCTAKVRGKYKENEIKNSKFIEKIKTSNIWNSIIQEGFSYIGDLSPKEDYLIKKMSSFVNSTFELVDFDTDDNGRVIEDIPQDQLIHEFSIFLSIILIKE